jgi:hypothetical protein
VARKTSASAKSSAGRAPPAVKRVQGPREVRSAPFEPGRAEPPFPILDDLDDEGRPPLAGKTHPREDMDEMTPTLDDERRHYAHHPNDAGSVEFGFEPEAADAAADLAGDLGATFLEGATRGEDMSDVEATHSDADEDELTLILDEDGAEAVDEEGPRPPVRQRPFEEPGALGHQSVADARPADEQRRPRRRKA